MKTGDRSGGTCFSAEYASLRDAIKAAGTSPTLICGSLFLVGEALEALGAYPWDLAGRDASELLAADR